MNNQARDVILTVLIAVIVTGTFGPIGLLATCIAIAYKYGKRGG